MPNLANLRQAKGWSQQQLAEHAGVAGEVVVGVEGGTVQYVSRDDLQKVAGALGVDPSTVVEFRPSLGLTALGETGSGERAKTGSPQSDS